MQLVLWYKFEESALFKHSVSKHTSFHNYAPCRHNTYLRKYHQAKQVMADLETDPDAVVAKLEAIRARVLSTKNSLIYLATDLDKLTEKYGYVASGVWSDLHEQNEDGQFAYEDDLKTPIVVKRAREYVNKNPEVRHVIAGESKAY